MEKGEGETEDNRGCLLVTGFRERRRCRLKQT